MKIEKIILLIIFACTLLALSSCSISNNNQQVVYNHTSANSLDWYGVYNGVYKGVTPCADCEGIKVKITLKRDRTFIRILKYLCTVDNYSLVDGVLSLNKAKMAPLARFELAHQN